MNGNLNVALHSVDALRLSLRDATTSRISIHTPTTVEVRRYDELTGLPTINGVTIVGDMVSGDLYLAKESINTKEYWDLQRSYVPERGEIVVYIDKTVIDNVAYPGMKIGDGNAYLIDLPFVGDDTYIQLVSLITGHIYDQGIHVTPEDKTRWDNKLNYQLNGENLIFNRL